MPIASNPARTFPYWLQSDADTPTETRPTLMVRGLTRKDYDRWLELFEQLQSETLTHEQAFDYFSEGIGLGVVNGKNLCDRWGNPTELVRVPVKEGEKIVGYRIDNLTEIFVNDEIREIFLNYPAAVRATEEEKKSSSSPSSSETIPTAAESAEAPVAA